MIPTGVDYSTYLNNFKLSGIIFSGGNSLSKLDNNILSSMRDKKEKTFRIFNKQKNTHFWSL